MFHHRIDRSAPLSALLHWCLLSCLAGYVNSSGLIACGRFVTHMTGFYTLIGRSTARLSFWDTLGFASVPFYFLFGVIAAAFIVERPIYKNRIPNYGSVMVIASLLFCACAFLGEAGLFGVFGGNKDLQHEYILIALLCTASGFVNGAISCASKHSVRVTHMTGNTTDLGISLVRLWSADRNSHHYADEWRSIVVRFGLIISFVIGSAIGAFLTINFQYLSFLFPSAIALYTAIYELTSAHRRNTGH